MDAGRIYRAGRLVNSYFPLGNFPEPPLIIIRNLAVLLFFQCLGELLVRWSGWLLPGPVVGMFLLFIALLLRDRLDGEFEQHAMMLVRHLPLFFLPAGVGIFFLPKVYSDALPALLMAVLIGTPVALGLTAVVTQYAARSGGRS